MSLRIVKSERSYALAGNSDGATQLAGKQAAEPKAATQAGQVLALLRQRGERGATYFEMQEALGWEYSTVGPRVRALRSAGYVYETDEVRTNPKSRLSNKVWRAKC